MNSTSPKRVPAFSDFLREKAGPNWVLARRTVRIVEKYGDDVVCLSRQKYQALVDEYEITTGFSANGFQGEPCDRIKAASLDLLVALKYLVAESPSDMDAGYNPHAAPLALARAAIAKAEGRS